MDLVGRLERILKTGAWVSHETLGVSLREWQLLKHDFRTKGGKRHLRVFDDAKPFLDWCRTKGWLIILVTSRPIDKYPNLFTDTVGWLTENHLPYDFLWWSGDKAERLEEAHIVLRSQIVFAVDDSVKFITQLTSKGIRSYLLDRYTYDVRQTDTYYQCQSLTQLMEMEESWQTTQTRNIETTQSTKESGPETQSLSDHNRLTLG